MPSDGCSLVSFGEKLMSCDPLDYSIIVPFEACPKCHSETCGVDGGFRNWSRVSFVPRAGSSHDLAVSDVVKDSACDTGSDESVVSCCDAL